MLLGVLLRAVTVQSLSPPVALALERSKKLGTPNVEELQVSLLSREHKMSTVSTAKRLDVR